MSGIAGYYGIDDPNGPAAHELLERMNRFQAHRGPDEEGFFQEGPCGMGHRRLVILDEQGGSQPMFSANGRFVLSFNGMVFNYQQLRHELAGLGHQFKTAADAEVVLAAWVEWGTECLDRFNGMWGMAVYDRLEQRLTLSRDHLGIKPLYYAPLGSQPGSASQEDTGGVTAPSANAAAASANAAAPAALIFSSELKPLVFSGQIERRPNDRSIFRYLRFRLHDDTADTFFAGIFQVMAGQLLEIDAQGIRVRSYTTLVDELRSSAKSDKHQPYGPDAARRYYEMLTESVRDRLKSDYPVGTALSGGMDSTTLATLVCQLMEQDPDSTKAVGSKQQTFSAVFPNSINDEECYIDAFIRDHNSTVDAHKCQPQAAEFVDGLDDFIYTMEQPIISTGPYAQYQMLKMAAKNVRVFLTGAGPDEMMAGYVPYYFVYLRQLLHRHHYLRFLREALAASDKVFRLLRVRFASRLGGKKAWDEKSFISPQFAAGYTDEHYQAVQDNLKLRLVDDLFVISAPCVARYEDRSAMRFSLEGRLPFANKDLVRYIWSMSDDALIKGGWNKHMLRDAMLPYLPREVLNRRNKIGFSTPEVEWFGMLKDKFLEIFESESFAARPYFNVGTVRQAFRAFYDGKGDATTLAFWRLLHLELWLRRFIDAPLPPTPEEPPHPRGGHLKNTTRPLPPLDGVS